MQIADREKGEILTDGGRMINGKWKIGNGKLEIKRVGVIFGWDVFEKK